MAEGDRIPAGWAMPSDLGTFNRWLNFSRMRAAAGLGAAVLALEWLHPGTFAVPSVLALCAVAVGGSLVGLRSRRLVERPARLFAAQTAFDLALVTFGLWVATSGLPAVLLRSVYVLVVTPVCLVTVPGGLVTAGVASVAHLGLLALERGATVEVLCSLEAAIPPVLFFLVAQHCFFYGGHLRRKNEDLRALAAGLEQHRRDLAAEARGSATLVEIARTLSTTLDADELLARVTRTMSEYLEAEWGATFLVDPDAGTFRIVATTDHAIPVAELGRIDFPLQGWTELACSPADGRSER
jgi:hypothetical protein